MTDFRFNPAEDDTVDSEYEYIPNENWTVQVCAYGGSTTYAVNEHGYDDPAAQKGFWMRCHGEFRSLKRAKDAIRALNAA